MKEQKEQIVIENPIVKVGFLELQTICARSSLSTNRVNTQMIPECSELTLLHAPNVTLQQENILCTLENCPMLKRYKNL